MAPHPKTKLCYSEEQMIKAISEVKTGGSVRGVAKMYLVPLFLIKSREINLLFKKWAVILISLLKNAKLWIGSTGTELCYLLYHSFC